MDETNRDLLVAVLALITGAIPRRALSEALSAWVGDRRQALAEVLLRDGSVDQERLRALVGLAESHLSHHNGDLRNCLDDWKAMGLMEDALTEVDDPALLTTVGKALDSEATLPAEPGDVPGGETAAGEGGAGETMALPDGNAGGPGPAPGAPGSERFQPIRMHARGGIGQVWVARDGELQREVALKVIQDRFAGSADQRARFLLEAEITGNLEHPGIVPVYSLGRDAQGRPYYAMRFIRGQSLAAAIRQFHLRWRAQGSEAGGAAGMWGVDFRQLLGRFLDVCDAIDYAHSRGVLHRDLKPANIMLGRYGETLVVDWGLAKVIGKPDIVPAAAAGEMEPSLSASATRATTGETLPGTTIGTPSYMSPEQARGALDEMGPASDVYSLGATLYEVLTGTVAFHGEKTAEVLQRVLKGDFRPPRAIVRSVPAPLEAICLKAMALERRERYDTVRELASDIQHWLADEPVVAYPEGRLERLGRWLRRHRTWTSAAAAALVAITVAATIGVVVVERGRRREAEARALAETNYHLARKAVEEYFTSVSEDTLLKEQDSVDLRLLRRRLLRTALGYYREFLRQRSGDPELRRELADAQFRVGQIIREVGDEPAEAIAAFNGSIALWDELRTGSPRDPEVRMGLARSCLALGEQSAWIRDFPPAFAALARSREILSSLRAEEPGDLSYRLSLADCDRELGIAETEAGDPDRGLGHLKEAEALLRGLLSGSPGDAGYRKRLADTINGEGVIYFGKDRDSEALEAFHEFQEICQSLLDGIPSDHKPAHLVNSLALSYFNMGIIKAKRTADRAEALRLFEKALEYRTALVAAHPSVYDFREKLGVSLMEIVRYRHEFGRTEEAFEAGRKSVEILEKLVASQPDQPRYRAELGLALNVLGALHDERRENLRAVPLFERAAAEEERAVDEAPESDLYANTLVLILQNLGEQYADLGRVDRAVRYYRRAAEVGEKLRAARGGDRGHTLDLADQLATLASIERHGGDAAGAERTYARAAALLEPLSTAGRDPAVELRRGAVLVGEGLAVDDRGPPARALPLLRGAVEVLGPLVSAGDEGGAARQRLGEALWELGRILREAGHSGEADSVDARRRALWAGRDPAELAGLAMEAASRAALIGYGRLPVPEAAGRVRRLDLDLAAEALRMAAALGFRDLDALRRHRDAALVLERPDIRPILEDIAFPEDPFAPVRRTD